MLDMLRIPDGFTAGARAGTPSKGVFVSAESLGTFPIATSFVIAAKQIALAVPALKGQDITAVFVAAILYGALLIYAGWPSPAPTQRQKGIALGVGVLNIVFLIAIGLGVSY